MSWLQSIFENTSPLNGQTICLTGIFEAGTHDEIKEFIREQGGVPVNRPGDWLDILVVGAKGNKQYCRGDEGHKIITAKQSANTLIVNEKDFLTSC